MCVDWLFYGAGPVESRIFSAASIVRGFPVAGIERTRSRRISTADSAIDRTGCLIVVSAKFQLAAKMCIGRLRAEFREQGIVRGMRPLPFETLSAPPRRQRAG